ncbi:HAMP domain-containing sensor histidine kinase [Chitinophaga sp.]|uniref:HAMP domain-containing sensor histidine kinase n=1 Tax=Chitinophaga sp. TaxID=1869181 RepID=UPI0031E0A0D2
MSLRAKLGNQSALIFACTLGFVLLGAYLLFEHYTREVYYKKLQGRANTAAFFYLEKDELNSARYREIEEKYKQISGEPIRLYHAGTRELFIDDKLELALPNNVLNTIAKQGSYNFRMNGRHFAGIFYKDNEGDFIVVASGNNTTGREQLAVLRWMLAIFFVLGIVINYVMTRWLARRTFSPFSRLIRKVNAITADNLHTRLQLPAGKPNELTALITTFNYFLERLEAGVKSQRNFLKNASHELKTPLAAIIGDIEVTLKQPRQQPEYEQQLQLLKKDALHLQSIMEGLLMLSGLEIATDKDMQPVRIDEILWNVLEKAGMHYPQAEISADFSGIADHEHLLMVNGNRELLFVALSNLLDNAIKFSRPHPIAVSLSVENNALSITITDQGPGIAEADQARIFDLFYRSSQTRHVSGHGIGLHLTAQILERHRAKRYIHSKPGEGTAIQVIFPAA